MDCSKYKDTGTAHRCRCGASVHAVRLSYLANTGYYACDRTNLDINECMVVRP